MKNLSILLLVAGLILGPGYYVYGVYFSGSSGERITVFSQDIEKLNLGTVQQYSTSNVKWNTPVNLFLTPDMNSVSLILEVTYLRPFISGRQERLDYYATLKNETGTVWNDSFSMKPGKRKKVDNSLFVVGPATGVYRKKILTFKVPESEKYSFELRRKGASKTMVKRINLAVRQNVMQPNFHVAMTGMALSVTSIVLLILLRLRK